MPQWCKIHSTFATPDHPYKLFKPEFRGRRRSTCWGKGHRTWLLNKFISFLAVLSWKSDKNLRQGYMNIGISLKAYEFSHAWDKIHAWDTGLKKYPKSVHFHTIWGSENDKVKVEKVTKINLKIISKLRALMQTQEKTCKVSKRPV